LSPHQGFIVPFVGNKMERKLAFGSALKEVRVRKEIAQEQLGASQSFVSTIERGIRSPTIEKMEEFAERLGVNPATLIVLMQVGQEGDVDELLAKIRDEIRALKRVGV
jgi:transcriptional regulator with XRE-family HTH domain